MATIPSSTKFIGLAASVDTTERRSAMINAESEAYTMQDIIDTVSPSVTANPSVIDLKVTDGTPITGVTSAAISQTILIPANTFTSAGGALEFMARYRKTGSAGFQTCGVWINTSSSLSGASAIASYTLGGGGGGGTNLTIQGIRTARISANTLTVYPANTSGLTDYIGTSLAQTSVAFNPAVDNYLLFTISLADGTDSSVVEMARAVKYE